MAKHKFSADNQPSRYRGRGPSKRTLLLEAVRAIARDENGEEFKDEKDAERGFYKIMVFRAMDKRDPQAGALLKEIFTRLAPQDKATLPLVEFPLREDGTASEKIEDIQSAVANGILSADMGKMMVDMVVQGIKVFEVDEMAARLARIEEMLASDGQG